MNDTMDPEDEDNIDYSDYSSFEEDHAPSKMFKFHMHTCRCDATDNTGRICKGNDKIATAVNEAFVPASLRDQTNLADGDRVEIVAPRQGG